MSHWRSKMPKPVCPSCGKDRALRRGGGLCLNCELQLSEAPQFDRICPDCGDIIYANRYTCECQNYLAYELPRRKYTLTPEVRESLKLFYGPRK